MRKMSYYWSNDTQYFFEGNELISYMSCNDGDYRDEYMGGLFNHFDIETEYLEKPNKKQMKIIKDLEKEMGY